MTLWKRISWMLLFYWFFKVLSSVIAVRRNEDFILEDDLTTWHFVEGLAESYPYIVALININKEYLCTGAIISKASVVTSAQCIEKDLEYIALGSAILDTSSYINENNLKKISLKIIYPEARNADQKETALYNQVGLVFSETNDLDEYFGFVDLIPEWFDIIWPLVQKSTEELKVVGYGTVPEKGEVCTIQSRSFHIKPCPVVEKYTLCAPELYTAVPLNYTHEDGTFGKGAALIYDTAMIATWGWECGVIFNSTDDTCYLFTAIGHLRLHEKLKPK